MAAAVPVAEDEWRPLDMGWGEGDGVASLRCRCRLVLPLAERLATCCRWWSWEPADESRWHIARTFRVSVLVAPDHSETMLRCEAEDRQFAQTLQAPLALINGLRRLRTSAGAPPGFELSFARSRHRLQLRALEGVGVAAGTSSVGSTAAGAAGSGTAAEAAITEATTGSAGGAVATGGSGGGGGALEAEVDGSEGGKLVVYWARFQLLHAFLATTTEAVVELAAAGQLPPMRPVRRISPLEWPHADGRRASLGHIAAILRGVRAVTAGEILGLARFAGPSCPVCLEPWEEIPPDRPAVVLACGHAFCEACLSPAARLQAACPSCRMQFAPQTPG